MNGIRQYFAVLPKEQDSPPPNNEDDVRNVLQGRKKGQKIVSNMESVIKSVRKKKSRKKHSDDAPNDTSVDISDISNILSCSLNLISPKKPPRRGKKVSPEHQNGQVEEILASMGPGVENEENNDDEQKKNVFEVMMQSRNKNLNLTSTPIVVLEKKRRIPEEFSQEDSTKKAKKTKRSPQVLEEELNGDEVKKKPQKGSRKKKLFELDVETVELPRRVTSPKDIPNTAMDLNGTFEAIEEERVLPKKKNSTKMRKRKKIANKKLLDVEVVLSSEPEIIEEEVNVRTIEKETISLKEEEIIPNGKHRKPRKRNRIEDVEDVIVMSEIESPQRRPQRSCRQKVLSYSLDMQFLDDDSPEKPKKAPKEKKNDVIVIDCTSPKAKVKLAPIFVKPLKPEIDHEALRAKQEFLMSGIPEKMRQAIDKQKALDEEFELEQFPHISHIEQLGNDVQDIDVAWREKKIDLKFIDEHQMDEVDMGHPAESWFVKSTKEEMLQKIIPQRQYLSPNRQIMTILRDLKKNTEDFPFKKVFNFFRQRQEIFEPPIVTPKRSSRKLNSSLEIVEAAEEVNNHQMYTDKYRPECCDEFIINSAPVEELKSFLESFLNDISLNGTFESIHDDSNSCYANSCCVVLSGACGSGKSAAVAAVATQLNFNVLEINAGMRRSGKRVMQELQEATQSHKVARGAQEKESHSLILVEDAEIAFEQDDGFIGAINQIVGDSKRPVILTTTEPNCAHLTRFMTMNVIHFSPPRPELISKWFTVMTLAEGINIQESDINDLYRFSGNDVRKTMMTLEFFTRSGGDAAGHKNVHKELNWSITSLGFKDASFDTLWYNTGPWLKDGALGEDLGEFYDVISAAEVLNHGPEEQEFTQYLLEGVLLDRKIPFNTYNHFTQPRFIEKSSLSSISNSRVAQLDYEPILRNICRSEQEKASRERRSTRFYHYLRQIVSGASNEFFERHCSILT